MEPSLLERLRRSARAAGEGVATRLERQHWMQSLPSRLIVCVFSTVLVTSFAVAFTATRSTEAFLRDEIDQKFPAALEYAAERLELWYGQRQLDVETFARSEIVEDHLQVLSRNANRRSVTRARAELQKYMDYVLQRFPQYEALFLLSPEGKSLLWAGEEVSLPDTLIERLFALERPRVSDIHVVGGWRPQVASAPVLGIGGKPIGSLHALLATAELDALLVAEDLSEASRVVAVDSRGEVVAPAGSSAFLADGAGNPETGEVGEFVADDGTRVIAAQQIFERFGWTLWVIEPYEAAFKPVVAMIRRVWAVNLAIVLLLGGVALGIARAMARPIHDLSRAARKIADGFEDVAIPVFNRSDELGVLSRALREMTARLSAKHVELQRANEILTQLSITDGLTGLHNHRAFQDRLVRDVRRAKRLAAPLSLALIDVDDFKSLNDRHGHAVGDQVLAAVAQVMHDGVREMDFAARYGGEEFAVLTPVALEGALILAEKLRQAIASVRLTVGESQVGVTTSIGVAELTGDGESLFVAADRALYRAKDSGKDCVIADET